MPFGYLRAERILKLLAVFVLGSGLGLVGCQEQTAAPKGSSPVVSSDNPTPETSAQGSQPTGAASSASVSFASAEDPSITPFSQATRSADNPPADSQKPPDETMTGKSAYKILEAVRQRWSTIRFTTQEGKKIDYVAAVETTCGTFKIALAPELAPNHVRNFIALVEVGYYEGLLVDRIRQEEDEGRTLQSIELGCPLGTGETAPGSLGYWMKDEFQPSEKATHDEGTVTACKTLEPDSAGCRFGVLLSKAPYLDGNYTIFGKVVEGLDVVRKIYVQPVIVTEEDRDGARRPEKPIVIKKITLEKIVR